MNSCNICNAESCFEISSFASPRYLCLLHYYTTGTHRMNNNNNNNNNLTQLAADASTKAMADKKRKKSSSLLADYHRMEKQLPQVQELFAEAFVELQKEISEESARVFQSVASAKDPLGMLLNSTASFHNISVSSRTHQKIHTRGNRQLLRDKKNENDKLEGGFIRETILPERLRKLYYPHRNNDHHDSFANRIDSHNDTSHENKSFSKKMDGIAARQQPTKNLYKRKPPTNIWNQILDSNEDTTVQSSTKEQKKTSWEDIEKEMTNYTAKGNDSFTKKCSTCGSSDVVISGNVTSRNNDMMKGEVWGTKNRSETVVERCRCLACGATWNDEDG